MIFNKKHFYIAGLFVAIIYLYKKILSPVLGQNCRFYPTCSVYAQDALRSKPLHIALLLIIKRVLKCHPYHAGGYDPVV